jgi:Caspase domain
MPSMGNAQTGKRYAIVVGINAYDHFRPLRFCVDDATEMAKVLGDNGWTVKLIVSMESTDVDDRPTPESIIKEFKKIAAKTNPQDSFLFYFCGHGFSSDPKTGYLALSSTKADNPTGTALPVTQLLQAANAIPCKEKAFFFDACRNTFKGKNDRSLVVEDNQPNDSSNVPTMGGGLFAALGNLSTKASAALFLSCEEGKTAAELTDLKHGVFTYAVIKGLSGGVVSPDGLVTAENLKPYLQEEIKNLEPDQKPFTVLAGSSTIVFGKAVKTQSTGIKITIQVDSGLRINHTTVFVDGDAAPVEQGFVSLKPGEHKINLVLEGPGVRTQNNEVKYQSIRREFKVVVSKKHEFSYHVTTIMEENIDFFTHRRFRTPKLVEEKLLDGRKF